MMDVVFGNDIGPISTQPRTDPRTYQRYMMRYENRKDVYTKLGVALKEPNTNNGEEELKSAVKTLRNPVHRAVEFHANAILTGTAEQAFPLADVDEKLKSALQLVWTWSNLGQRKQVLKRYTAIYGQCFIKVNSPSATDRVYLQVIKPEQVSDFDKDERGNLVYLRMDVPFEREEGSPPKMLKKVHTEVWRKGAEGKPGYYRTWENDEKANSGDTVVIEKSLGTPKVNLKLSNVRGKDSFGFDFVPFADVSAMDTGEKRPKPIYHHALPLIDEQNRMATRLHDLLFRYNKPFKALQGIGNDAQGRPLEPPQVQGQPTIGSNNRQAFGGSFGTLVGDSLDDLSLGGDILFGLPGNSQMVDVTPNLDFGAARNAILDMANELREELPELLYYATKDSADSSGYHRRLILAGAVDRAAEMRANINSALIKVDKMALTIAQVRGLSGFGPAQIGTYENGEGFRHEFEEQEILTVSDSEREDARAKKIANAQTLIAMGAPQEAAMKEVGLEAFDVTPPM